LDAVDGQAVLADQPARAACGGQPPDPDAAVVAAADAQPVRLQRACDVEPPRARFDAHHARAGIGKRDVVHGREVEDDPAVVRRAAGHAVATAADGERQVRVLRGEQDGRAHVLGVPGLQDDRRRSASEERRRVVAVERVLRRDGHRLQIVGQLCAGERAVRCGGGHGRPRRTAAAGAAV
jgi:hypothetical protein